MLVEGLQRLSAMADLQAYEYIGFGALEFVDFEMMRRGLGISFMFLRRYI